MDVNKKKVRKVLNHKISQLNDIIADIEVVLPTVDEWANGREKYWVEGDQESAGEDGYLGGFFVMKVFPNQAENISLEDIYDYQGKYNIDETDCKEMIQNLPKLSLL